MIKEVPAFVSNVVITCMNLQNDTAPNFATSVAAMTRLKVRVSRIFND